METINNVANAAAKAVWGSPDSHQEPVSGVKGDTAKGQPYDAGNMEPEDARRIAAPNEDKPFVEHLDTAATSETSANNLHTASPSTGGQLELQHAGNAGSIEHASKPSPAPGGNVDVLPSDLRSDEIPVPEADLKQPGPKPLDILAREHGGDAGNVGKDVTHPTATSDDDPQKNSHGEGTGEKHIKSTGFAAEGGDFDAANAGAGREADRLIEEHGGSPPTGDSHKHNGHSVTKHASSNSTGSGEKKTLKDKIKAKLHMH